MRLASCNDLDNITSPIYSAMLFEGLAEGLPVMDAAVLDYRPNGQYFEGEKVYEPVGNKFNLNKLVADVAVGASVIVVCAIAGSSTAGAGTPVALFFTGATDKIVDMLDNRDLKLTASTRRLYSTDDGTPWSETMRSAYVGKPYFVAIKLQVTQSKQTREQHMVQAIASIPKNDGARYSLSDHPGGSLVSVSESDGATKYKFNIVAVTSPSKFRVIFECLPTKTGKASVTVTYDDQLSDAWDSTGTVNYIEQDASGPGEKDASGSSSNSSISSSSDADRGSESSSSSRSGSSGSSGSARSSSATTSRSSSGSSRSS